ncbi:MAG: hypothetical protein RMY36_026360 [Nostoc sp. SerVER01]|nr:hypothetical protein [Nostoc sp. SerVER01]
MIDDIRVGDRKQIFSGNCVFNTNFSNNIAMQLCEKIYSQLQKIDYLSEFRIKFIGRVNPKSIIVRLASLREAAPTASLTTSRSVQGKLSVS